MNNGQLALHEEQVPVVASDAASIMAVIDRAARDPSVDVGKMERLVELYERLSARQAKAAYTSALAAMQPTLPVIIERGGIKDRGGNIQSTYALWEDINDAIKPILAEHGFALSFRTGRDDGQIIVTGVLSHRDGHSEETTMHLPVDTSGSKNAVQAVGSSTSYGKRYTAQALLNLTSRGEDDDGKAAGANGAISDEQVQTIFDLIKKTKSDTVKLCKYVGVDAVPDIRAKDYEKVITALNLKEKKVQQ